MKHNRGRYLVIFLGILMIFRIGANVVRLIKAGEQAEEVKKELAEAEKKNAELKKTLALVQTPEYMERQAREKLGYGLPGEVELVMPEEQRAKSQEQITSENLPNWKQWRKLYLGF
jgi:cell division protein FtsB